MAGGESPYSQDRYIYPPPLAAAGAVALELGGTQLVLGLLRGANLLGLVALAVFAAGLAGLSPGWRYCLAAALVALPPFVAYAVWIGNPTSVAAALALAGWQIGKRRPLTGASLVGISIALKPLALAGALVLAARWWIEKGRSAQRTIEALAWLPVTALCLAPWAAELPALARRMADPPVLSPRNLSFRRVFDGFGLDAPATAITLAVIAAAILLARRRPVDDLDRLHTAPVVALLALPVAWAHGFLFVLPLQVAAGRRWWERRARRANRSWRALAERWGVPLALGLIQGSANAGVEFAAPEPVRAAMVLLPMLSPLALLAYLRATETGGSPAGTPATAAR